MLKAVIAACSLTIAVLPAAAGDWRHHHHHHRLVTVVQAPHVPWYHQEPWIGTGPGYYYSHHPDHIPAYPKPLTGYPVPIYDTSRPVVHVVRRVGFSAHAGWCAARFRSYDARTDSWQPYHGPTHEVYSFLITTWASLQEWLPLRTSFRERWIPDKRRLSFKQLREPVRRRAYPHFLEVAGALKANLITIMIDNRVGSFADGGPKALAAALDDCFVAGAPSNNIEKIQRLAFFVAMLQAGLRREDQRSFWISDHDETLDTFEKREGFARLATYLTIGLTGRRNSAEHTFMTTEAKGVPDWAEDLASIPDIAAGACASLSTTLPTFIEQQTWTVGVIHGGKVDWRAKIFGDWLSSPDGVLRHVLLRLAPDARRRIQASAQKFVRR